MVEPPIDLRGALPPVVGRLPEAYASALAGVAEGLTDAALAERVGVEPAAVPALLRLATVKLLEALVAEAGPTAPGRR